MSNPLFDSLDIATANWPLGLIPTVLTMPPARSRFANSFPVRMSDIRIVWSLEAVMISRPSALNAAAVTLPERPLNPKTSTADSASQSRTFEEADQVAILRRSGLIVAPQSCSCRSSMTASCLPASMSKTLTVFFCDIRNNKCPSVLK